MDGIDSTQFLRSDVADTKTNGDLSFSDAVEAKFGDSSDLRIYHNNHSYIINGGTGNLHIRNTVSDQDIIMMADDGSGSFTTYLQAEGASGEISLHHYGSKKLATKSNGIDVTGHVETDSVNVSGAVTANSFYGDGSNLTGISGGGSSGVEIENDGTSVGTGITAINFSTNVTATASGGIATITASGGGGGGASAINDLSDGFAAGNSVGLGTGALTNSNSTDQNNTALGYNAGLDITSGTNNVLLGYTAGRDITTANGNIAIGNALNNSAGVTGNYNIAISGDASGRKLTTGNNNVFMGSGAGKNVTTGASNVYIGDNAASSSSVTTGLSNTFVGRNAGQTNTASYGVCIGSRAGTSVTGNNNTIIGNEAQYNVSLSGTNNLILGANADASGTSVSNEITLGDANITKFRVPGIGVTFGDNTTLTDGHVLTYSSSSGEITLAAASGGGGGGSGVSTDAQGNTYAGDLAGGSFDGTNAQYNTLYGYDAGGDITTGDYNTCIGWTAGDKITTGSKNVALGAEALDYCTTGSQNVAVGWEAGRSISSGMRNTCVGDMAGRSFGSNSDCIAIGYHAASNFSSSNHVIALGSNSAFLGGASKIAIGENSMSRSTDYCIGIGQYTGRYHTGDYSIFMGYQAGQGKYSNGYQGTGSNNILIGYQVLKDCWGAYDNTIVGTRAGIAITESYRTVAIGVSALKSATSGSENVVIGALAAQNLTTGDKSVYIGAYAASNVTTVNQGVSIGYNAGLYAGTDYGFTAIGYEALKGSGSSARTTCFHNTAVGFQAGHSVINGSKYNCFFGYDSGEDLTTGSRNQCYGYMSGRHITTGENNICIGHKSGSGGTEYARRLTTGDNNIVIGHNGEATSSTVSNEITLGNDDNNKFRIPGIGITFGDNSSLTDGHVLTYSSSTGEVTLAAASGGGGASEVDGLSDGFAVGDSVGLGTGSLASDDGTSNRNTAVGKDTLNSLTTGQKNVAMGYNAGDAVTTGTNLVLLGSDAGGQLTTQSGNVFVGEGAGQGVTGMFANGNVAVGRGAYGRIGSVTGGGSVAIGENALVAVTDGSYNVGVGYEAGDKITTGENNVCLGRQAGDELTTGSNNLVIGYGASAGAATTSNEITLGNTDIVKFRIPGLNLTHDSTNLNIGSNDSSNPFQYLRFGASQYGAADIRPTNEASHKVGLSFYTDGTQDSTINPTERMRITSSGKIGLNTTSPGCQTGGIHVVHANEEGTPTFTGGEVGIFQRNYNSAQGCHIGIIGGSSGSSSINFGDKDDADRGIIQYAHDNDSMRFYTNAGERMRITHEGYMRFGQTTSDSPGYGNQTTGISMLSDGRFFSSTGGTFSQFNRNSNGSVISFARSSTGVGQISVTTTSTSYGTSSDYRLKENVVDLDGAITRVKQLQPRRFNFIADADTTVDGFLAHEAQTVVPEAVTGTHNGVDDNNNPVYQDIDQSKLVPLLTAALQEAIAKIETLETSNADLLARVTALEG